MASNKSSLVPKNVKNALFSTGIANFPAEEFTQGVVLLPPPKESDQLLAKELGGEVDTFLGQNVTDFAIGQIPETEVSRSNQQPPGPSLLPPPPPITSNFKAAPTRISAGRPPDQTFLPVEPLSQSEPDFKYIPLDDSIPLYNPKSVLNSSYQTSHELNRIIPPLESGVHLYDPSCVGSVLPPHATKRPLAGRIDHSPAPTPVVLDPAFSSLSKHISTYSPSLVIDSGPTESATSPEVSRKSSSSSSANELSSTLTNSQDYRTAFLPSSSSTSSLYSNVVPNNLKSPALVPQSFHQSASTPSLYPHPSNSSVTAVSSNLKQINSVQQPPLVPLYSSAPSLSNTAPPNLNSGTAHLPASSTFPNSVTSGFSVASPPASLYQSNSISSAKPLILSSHFAPSAPPETLSSTYPYKNYDNSLSYSTLSGSPQSTVPLNSQLPSPPSQNNYSSETSSVIASEPEVSQTTFNQLPNSEYSISNFLNQLNPFKKGPSPTAHSAAIKTPPSAGFNDILLTQQSNASSNISDPVIPQPVKTVPSSLPTPPKSQTPASVGAALPPPPLTGFQVSSAPLTSLPNVHHSILANSNPYSIISKKKSCVPILKPEHYFTPIPVDELSKEHFEESTHTTPEVSSQGVFLSSTHNSDISANTFIEDSSNTLQEQVPLTVLDSSTSLLTQSSLPHSASVLKETEPAINTPQETLSTSLSAASNPSLIQSSSLSSTPFLPPPPLSGFQAFSSSVPSRISPKFANILPEHNILPPSANTILDQVSNTIQTPVGTTNEHQPIAITSSDFGQEQQLKLSQPTAIIDSKQDSLIPHQSPTTFSHSFEGTAPSSSDSTQGEGLLPAQEYNQPLQPLSGFSDTVPLISNSDDSQLNQVPLLPTAIFTNQDRIVNSLSAPPPNLGAADSSSSNSSHFVSTIPQGSLQSTEVPISISSERSQTSFCSPPPFGQTHTGSSIVQPLYLPSVGQHLIGPPVSQPPTDQPIAEPLVSEPFAGPPVSQLFAGPPVVQPLAGSRIGQPFSGPPIGETLVGPPIDQPLTGPPIGQPLAGPPLGQPPAGPPIGQPPAGPPLSTSQPISYRLSSLKKKPTYAPVSDLGFSQIPSAMAYHQETLNNVDPGDFQQPSVQTSSYAPDSPPLGSRTPPTYQPFIAMAVSQTYRQVYHHWFYKNSKKNQWFPFSMADSLNLEQQFTSDVKTDDSKLIATDGGRYDVDVEGRKRLSVYWHEEESEVRRCSWFVKGPIDSRYQPYDENIAALLEEEYKTACTKNEWNRRVELADGEVIILHSPNSIAHHQRSSSPDPWGNPPPMQEKPRTVKRGLDEFDIPEGEPTQVDHLLLLVHGIGKVCDLRFRSLVEVVDDFRNVAVSLVGSHYKSAVERGKAGRVEVLPVEWHRALHTEAIDQRLADITLPSIPRAREFTNETLLDILFYTSPVFCERIVQAVGDEVNRVYSLYISRNPGYKGGVSLGGHSLGSLILFDMLCHQKPPHPRLQSTPSFSFDETDEDISSLGCLKTRARLSRRMSYVTIGTAGTGQPYIQYPQLRFQPRAFFALGSPIGMFVTVRGIESLGEEFRFPTCPSFFNIFHPNDPVAYRIEGLINPEMAHHPAILIPHHKGRKRMHLELKETMAHVTAALKQKLLDSVKNTWNTVSSLTRFSKMDSAAIENQVDKAIEDEMMCKEDSSSSVGESAEAEGTELKVGQLNGGRRIDYVLQEAPLETFNQYISAVRSHLVYWESEDTMLLILKEIYSTKGITADCQVPQPILPFDLSPEANADPGTAYSHFTVASTPLPSRQNTIVEEPL